MDRVDLATVLEHDLIFTPPNPAPVGSSYVDAWGFQGTPDGDPVATLRRRNERAMAMVALEEDKLLVYQDIKDLLSERVLDIPLSLIHI